MLIILGGGSNCDRKQLKTVGRAVFAHEFAIKFQVARDLVKIASCYGSFDHELFPSLLSLRVSRRVRVSLILTASASFGRLTLRKYRTLSSLPG